ncbi:MAG: hypothetical protein HY755_08695 [Nitrospirae bacterium]|nr:hypothetical protein [Nitrospirota bacterium]
MSNLPLKQRHFFLNLNSLKLIILIFLITFPCISLANADKVFKENSKAVVVVITYKEKGEPISQGSGFIVRTDGAIITNYHVISNAKSIKVKAGDKVLDVEGLIHADKENFDGTLRLILNGSFQFNDRTNLSKAGADLAVTYGIRNHGAHKVTSVSTIYLQFKEIRQRLFNTLFFAVELLY